MRTSTTLDPAAFESAALPVLRRGHHVFVVLYEHSPAAGLSDDLDRAMRPYQVEVETFGGVPALLFLGLVHALWAARRDLELLLRARLGVSLARALLGGAAWVRLVFVPSWWAHESGVEGVHPACPPQYRPGGGGRQRRFLLTWVELRRVRDG